MKNRTLLSREKFLYYFDGCCWLFCVQGLMFELKSRIKWTDILKYLKLYIYQLCFFYTYYYFHSLPGCTGHTFLLNDCQIIPNIFSTSIFLFYYFTFVECKSFSTALRTIFLGIYRVMLFNDYTWFISNSNFLALWRMLKIFLMCSFIFSCCCWFISQLWNGKFALYQK